MIFAVVKESLIRPSRLIPVVVVSCNKDLFFTILNNIDINRRKLESSLPINFLENVHDFIFMIHFNQRNHKNNVNIPKLLMSEDITEDPVEDGMPSIAIGEMK